MTDLTIKNNKLNLMPVAGLIRDVEVKRHPYDGSPIACVTLHNGFAMSILAGGGECRFYCRGDGSDFEVALIHPNGELDYSLHYNVWGHVEPKGMLKIIEAAAKLDPDAPNVGMGDGGDGMYDHVEGWDCYEEEEEEEEEDEAPALDYSI